MLCPMSDCNYRVLSAVACTKNPKRATQFSEVVDLFHFRALAVSSRPYCADHDTDGKR